MFEYVVICMCSVCFTHVSSVNFSVMLLSLSATSRYKGCAWCTIHDWLLLSTAWSFCFTILPNRVRYATNE